MNRLRILYVTPSLGAPRGGPSTMIEAMRRALANLGYIVDIATTDDDGRSRVLPSKNADDPSHLKVFPRRTYFYTIAPSLGRWVRRRVHDYDVVHLFALFSYPVIPVSRAAYRSRVPYVVSPLGSLNRWGLTRSHPWLKRASLALVERPVLRRADAVHFNSHDEAQQARRVAAFRRHVVIPPPVGDFAVPPDVVMERFRRRFPQLATRRAVLFLSRFDSTKGLDELIPAFDDIRRAVADAVLVLAGDGQRSLVAEVDRWIQQHGLEDHVLRAGFLSGDDKRAALASADVFVQPSHTENFGISVAEAMAAGLPVVVTETSGISDIVGRSGAGIVVPPRRAEISRALTQLLSDAARRDACARNAKQAAAEHFAPHHVAVQLLQLYQDIVTRS